MEHCLDLLYNGEFIVSIRRALIILEALLLAPVYRPFSINHRNKPKAETKPTMTNMFSGFNISFNRDMITNDKLIE